MNQPSKIDILLGRVSVPEHKISADNKPDSSSMEAVQSKDFTASVPAGTPMVETDFGDVIPAQGYDWEQEWLDQQQKKIESVQQTQNEVMEYWHGKPKQRKLTDAEQMDFAQTLIQSPYSSAKQWGMQLQQQQSRQEKRENDLVQQWAEQNPEEAENAVRDYQAEQTLNHYIRKWAGNETPENLRAVTEVLATPAGQRVWEKRRSTVADIEQARRENDEAFRREQKEIHSGNAIGQLPGGESHYRRANTLLDYAQYANETIGALEQAIADSRGISSGKASGERFLHGLMPRSADNVDMFRETGILMHVADVAEKLSMGKRISDPEKALMSAYIIYCNAQSDLENLGGKTGMEFMGSAIGDNAPFLLEMAVTGGFGGAAAGAARSLMRKGIAAGVKNAARKGLKGVGGKILQNRAGRYVAKQSANLLGSMVGGAATAPFSNATWGEFARQDVDQYDISQGVDGEIEAEKTRPTSLVERGYKAGVTGMTELGSEYWGGFAGAGRLFPKALRGTRVARITEPLRRFMQTPSAQRLDRYVGNVLRWNGQPMEWMEEQLSNVLQPLLTGELERIRENFSSEAQMETLLGVVAMGGVFQTMGTGAAAYDHVQSRRRSVGLLGHIQNPDLRQQVSRAMGRFTQKEQAKAISNIDWDNASLHDMAAATDYIMHRTQGRASQEIMNAMQEQTEAHAALQRFNKLKNQDTGRLEEVFDTQGRRYFLSGGALEKGDADAVATAPTADGTLFVIDAETGEVSQKSIDELKRGQTTSYEEFEAGTLEAIRTVSAAQSEMETLQDIAEEAEATGDNPALRVADYMGIDLSTLTGKTVTLRGGSMAYVGNVSIPQNGTPDIDVVPLDPVTGMTQTGANGEEIHRPLDITEVAAVEGIPVGPETADAQTTPSEGEGVASQTPELQNGQQGTLDDGTQVGTQNTVMENADTGSVGQVSVENPGMNPELDNATTSGVHNVSDPRIGRSLTSQEADELLREMQDGAQPAPEIELNAASWSASFDENNSIQTPIGRVKMGDNQMSKFFAKGREKEFGMVAPTLSNPDVIVEKNAPESYAERDTKYLFIKTFIKSDGSRFVYFESITVQKAGLEISVSSHEADENIIKREMQNGKVLHLDSRLSSGSEGYLTRTPTGEGPDLVPTSDNPKALHKDTNSAPSNQEIPRKKDGTPDYAALEPGAMFQAIAEDFGEDVAREEVARQIEIYEAKIKKLAASRSEDINVRLKNRNQIQSLQAQAEALREAAGIADNSVVGQTQKTAAPTVKHTTLRDKSRALGDYLSVEDKILRDIAEGLKFRWSDNGAQRGLGTELGFSDSPAERKARFNILSNDGITVDQYAERLEHDMDSGLIPLAMDGDMRSAILDVLTHVRSNREAYETAVALRENDPRTSMTEDEARQQTAYEASRRGILTEAAAEQQQSSMVSGEPFTPVDDVPFYRSEAETAVASQDFSPEHRQAVEEMVTGLNQELGENVVVFSEWDELPEKIREEVRKAMEDGYVVYGLTFQDACYLYSPAITDEQTAHYVYTHELAGHKNVEAVFPDRISFVTFCNRLVDDIGVSEMAESISDAGFMNCVNDYFTNPDAINKYVLGREYIAYLTENSNVLDLYAADYEGKFSLPSLQEFITTDTLLDLIHYANSRQGRSFSQGQGRMGRTTETEADYRRTNGTTGMGASNTDRLSGGGQTADRGRSRPDGVSGSGTDYALSGASDNLSGRTSPDAGGTRYGRSTQTSSSEYQGTISGQDNAGVDSNQPRTLPAGETVTGTAESEIFSSNRFRRESAAAAYEAEIQSIIDQAKANGTYLKAPNGKPTRLSERQWAQVRTRAFKRWFGDWEHSPENASQFVDANGEPKLFYHNTNTEFYSFDPSKNGTNTDAGWLGDGFYFYGDNQEGRGYGSRQLEVFLRVDNPYYATAQEHEELAEANSRERSVSFRESLEDSGYDGVYFNGDLRQEAVVFFPNQIKSATDNTGEFSADNDDIRFRKTPKPQEESASLIAVHNTTEEQLKKSLELGGFPMPSIAITHAGMGHTEFGEISLLFDRNSIDPANRQNKVYSGDAWTPTVPSIGYKLNDDKTSDIYSRANKVKNLPLFNPVTFHPDNYERNVNGLDTGGLVEHFKDNYNAKQFYLAENGNAVTEYEQHEVEKYPADKIPIYEDVLKRIGIERIVNGNIDSVRDEVRQILEQHGIGLSQMKPNVVLARVNNTIKAALDYAENGNKKTEIDVDATKQKIDERIDQQRFEAWLHELFNGVVEKKGIRNDRDIFTPAGNSRKWEELYDEVTLDNIVKAMQRQAARGGQGLFGGSIFGAAQKEYPSIDEIRKEAKKVIKNITNDEFEAQKNAITDRLSDVKIPGVGSSFSDTMDMAENIKDAVSQSHTPKGIYRYLKEFYSGMTMEAAEEIADIVRDIQQMSSRYFESKPQRAVGFDEVRLAVVPVNTDAELIRQLERQGIPVRTYERGNEEQRREIVANATEELDIRFRRAEAATLSPDEVNERFNEELKQQIDGTLPEGHVYRLGMPSEALRSAGVPELPIELSASRLAEKASPKYSSNHPFALDEVENLPQALQNPIAVFDSKTRQGSKVILTELQSKGHNFVAILRVQKKGPGWTEVEINDIRSLYPKDRVGGIIDWINNGLLRWADKEKAADFLLVQGPNYLGNGENTGGNVEEGSNLADEKRSSLASATNIIKNFANPTRADGEKVAAAEEMAAELGVPVRIVRNRSEIGNTESLARDKRGAEGWHERATGEIAVVLPNCRDAAEVQKTILHEAVGHYGIPELLGRERADEFYRRVFRSLDKTTQARLMAKHGSETVAGDEYLAEMAEGNVTPSVWKRIMAAIRGFFRDVLGIDLKVTDAEMRYILWRSKNNLARARTVSEAMDTIAQDIRMRAQTEREAARERKAQQLEKLRKSEPLMFTGEEYKGLYELDNKSAANYINNELRGKYVNQDTGETIRVTRKGAFKTTRHDVGNKAHLQSVVYIPQMLENAILIDEVPNTKSSTGFDSYRYYVVGLKIDGVDYTAKLVVGEKNGQIYYDHALTEIEKGDLINRRDEISSSFTDNKAANAVTGTPVFTVKDKRLLQILQPEPLKYQAESTQNKQQEPKTPMQYVDRVAEEMAALDNEIRFRSNKQQPAADAPIRTTRENWATRIGRKLQDAHIPVRQLQDYVRAHGGKTGIETDVYSALNRALGRQMERIRRVDADFSELGKKMNRIKREYGYSYKQIEEYLAAKSSLERHASGTPAYSEQADAPWNKWHVEETVDRFEKTVPAKQRDAMWADIRTLAQKQLEMMRQYGLISIQTLRDIQARGWKYYLPLQGMDFDFEQVTDPHDIFGEILNDRKGGRSSLMHRAKGRTTKPDDVLATLQRNIHLTIMSGEQNLAKQFLLRLAEANPELQGDTRRGEGVFEIEERWWVRRDENRITPEERERGEVYEESRQHPDDLEIEQSQIAAAEMRKLESELQEVEKELWKLNPETTDNDLLSTLLDRRRELSERIDQEFDRITAVRQLPRGAHAYRGLSQTEEQEHTVPVYRNGIRTVVRLSDPIVAQAINGDFKELFGGIMKNVVNVIGKGTRWMASTSTSWNPEFLLKNTVRDSLWATFYNAVDSEGSARGYLRNYPVAQKAIVRYHSGKARPLTLNERAQYNIYTPEGAAAAIEEFGLSRVRDSWFDDFLMEGGLTGYAYMQDVRDYSKKLARKVRWAASRGGRTVGTLREVMETVNDLSEVTTRFSTFLSQIQKGEDVRTAVNYARDITINFNRKGEWGRDLNSLFMFFNAATQGIANFYNLTRRNKARMGFAMAGVLGLSYTMSLLLAQFLAADDDDEQWFISDYQRYTNLCIPGWIIGRDDKVVLIPLPQELRPIWVAGTVAADVTGGRIDAKDAWGVFSNATGTVLEAAGEAYLPVEISMEHPMKTFVPSVFKPMYELYANADFTGFPIYREPFAKSLEGRIPESQLGMRNANKFISGVTEWLNEVGGGNQWTPAGFDPETGTINGLVNLLDQNPSKIEHLLTSYTGGLGRMGARIYRYVSSPDEERAVRDIPFINAFLTDVRKEINPNTEYYDIRDKYESLNYWFRKHQKEGTYPPFYHSDEEAQKAAAEVTAVMQMIKQSDKTLDAWKKQLEMTEYGSEQYRTVVQEMNRVKKDFIHQYDQLTESTDHAAENR